MAPCPGRDVTIAPTARVFVAFEIQRRNHFTVERRRSRKNHLHDFGARLLETRQDRDLVEAGKVR